MVALELQRRGHVPVIATSEYYAEKINGAARAADVIETVLRDGR